MTFHGLSSDPQIHPIVHQMIQQLLFQGLRQQATRRNA